MANLFGRIRPRGSHPAPDVLEQARTRTPVAVRSITEGMLRLPFVELDDRSDNPAAPPAGRYRLFVKSGDLYGIDSDSNVTAY